MNEYKNPWENMPESTQRRVDFDTEHNFFWITDLQGNYGLYLKSDEIFNNDHNLVRLNGISILKRNSDENFGEFFLLLHKKEDWQIFYTLCQDLIKETHKSSTNEKPTATFEMRLKRWQSLLSTT